MKYKEFFNQRFFTRIGPTPHMNGHSNKQNLIPDLVMETTGRMLSFSSREKVTACEEDTQPHHPKTPNPKTPSTREREWRVEEWLINRRYCTAIILYEKEPELGQGA